MVRLLPLVYGAISEVILDVQAAYWVLIPMLFIDFFIMPFRGIN